MEKKVVDYFRLVDFKLPFIILFLEFACDLCRKVRASMIKFWIRKIDI